MRPVASDTGQQACAISRVQQYALASTSSRVLRDVCCSAAGLLMAQPDLPGIRQSLFAIAGIWIVSIASALLAGAGGFRIDGRRQGAANSPNARHEVGASQWSAPSMLICAAGCVVLLVEVNLLTTWLALVSFVAWGAVLSGGPKAGPLLQSILMRGATSAMAPLIGWTAVRDDLSLPAALMWLMIFLWTQVHLWTHFVCDSYDQRRACMPFSVSGRAYHAQRQHVLVCTVLLWLSTLLPCLAGMSGDIYLIAALALGSAFTVVNYHLLVSSSNAVAVRAARFSSEYLALLFAALLVDHYLPVHLAV